MTLAASSRPVPTPGAALASPGAARIAFVATVLVAAALPWLAPRSPLVDLPQHAAQVALWRDLLSGTSRWGDLVRINLLTPYLIGYGLLLPLSVVMPLASAVRLLLSADLLAFVAAFVALRRTLGGDRRLDWLVLFGPFGFAWRWGFLTFLTAAPLALVVLLLAVRHAERPARVRGALLAGAGLALLFAHGLLFLVAVGLGGLLALRRLRLARGRGAGAMLAPYALLALALVAFRLLTRDDADGFQADHVTYGVPLWLRPAASLAYVSDRDWGDPLAWLAVAGVLAVPVLLRPQPNRAGGVWLLAGLGALLLTVPGYALGTGYLYERLALFLLPFVALALAPPAREHPACTGAALVLGAGACWFMLAVTAVRLVAFAAESRSFETVLRAAPAGERALALVYDPASPAAGNADAYLHWPAWYGADKGGFVDFNFARFAPQIVRFRPGRQPPVTDAIGRHPDRYDWRDGGRPYRLVFFRGSAAQLAAVHRASPCPLTLLAADEAWRLLRREDCVALP